MESNRPFANYNQIYFFFSCSFRIKTINKEEKEGENILELYFRSFSIRTFLSFDLIRGFLISNLWREGTILTSIIDGHIRDLRSQNCFPFTIHWSYRGCIGSITVFSRV
jgi:hypothetical protein